MTPSLPDIQSEVLERFDERFSDELIDRFQEYAYSEGHNKPLAEAKEKVGDIKSFLKESLTTAFHAGEQAAEERVWREVREMVQATKKSVGDLYPNVEQIPDERYAIAVEKKNAYNHALTDLIARIDSRKV